MNKCIDLRHFLTMFINKVYRVNEFMKFLIFQLIYYVLLKI